MKLRELLKALKSYKFQGSEDTEIFGIQYDSRAVGKGSLFVAMKGEKTDGNLFAGQAIENGAVAVLTDQDRTFEGAVTIQVPKAREALARLSAAFYGEPARNLKLVGITGTNGKTTTSFLVESILREAGLNPGVIGTINYRCSGRVLPAPNTTPESLDLQRLLREMVGSGVKAVVMEVSSHALDQERVGGLIFDAGVFTNLTQDHLDYHGTMESYFEAKARLFTDFIDEGRAAVINMDDPRGDDLSKMAAGTVIGYSGKGRGNLHPKDVRLGVDGIEGNLMTPSGDVRIRSSLIGEFNLYNILAAVGVGVGLGLPKDAIESGIMALKNVPGRLERVDAGQPFTILVDYAHTPDALERVLSTIKGLTDKRIVTVFGCGGDRDRGKRPIMGRVAAEFGDVVIVTSDNPRTEDPLRIIEEIKGGIVGAYGNTPVQIIPDRREAIRKAVSIAKEGDVVLIAGKGHEDYQIIGTEKIHFDDREEAAKAVREGTVPSPPAPLPMGEGGRRPGEGAVESGLSPSRRSK
jgi:UDP-N-acetylmuramoyl-L-alanyl-D-glutamate--2,6-diaminopimelate ligase